jgi:hypothetical protein
MFRFLQELEQRLRDAARDGSFKEVMGLLEQGVNVDAADEVRHVIPCHVCFMPIALEGVSSGQKGIYNTHYHIWYHHHIYGWCER